jgi:hypothetical protein
MLRPSRLLVSFPEVMRLANVALGRVNDDFQINDNSNADNLPQQRGEFRI